MGDEPYYIDIVSNFIEKSYLKRKDLIKPFYMVGILLKILSLQPNAIHDGGTSGGNCKEAQDLSRTIDKRAMPIIQWPLPF
jgi:hypothetical protein